ncbi:MAG TPA: isoprenylcysteine carboxylmethyltransferase family protein [Thermoanaerobaculia bacterium]|nr:isoprenylcysteine carboxylmethyltransferase family protein [Thermoanaerobaculia bacterium]
MRPLVYIWPYAAVFWLVYIWAFWPELKLVHRGAQNVAANASSKDAGSLKLVVRGTSLAMLAAFLLAFVAAGQFGDASRAFWIGTTLLILGSLLRRHCWRVLGNYFTGDVQVSATQPVIDSGAYRWVRHPSYTAGMLMFIGIGIALSNWLSLTVLLLVSTAVYAYRVSVEEGVLLSTLGDEYRSYTQRTKRFIPYVF